MPWGPGGRDRRAVTVYKLTAPYSPPKDEEVGITNPSLRATFQMDYSKTRILTYGFHGASFDPEGGIMLQDFSIPQPGDRDYGTRPTTSLRWGKIFRPDHSGLCHRPPG